MKLNSYTFLIVFFLLCFQAVSSMAQSDLVSQVKESIKAGSAKELSKCLYQTVDVIIDNKADSYSKAQAEFVFRDFFKQHTPSEFNILHQGSSKGGQPYAIGQYKSGSDSYRVFMKIKVVGNQHFVHEISFVKE